MCNNFVMIPSFSKPHTRRGFCTLVLSFTRIVFFNYIHQRGEVDGGDEAGEGERRPAAAAHGTPMLREVASAEAARRRAIPLRGNEGCCFATDVVCELRLLRWRCLFVCRVREHLYTGPRVDRHSVLGLS